MAEKQVTPRYELHYDAMEDEWTIHRVEVLGPFKSRAEARQYMIDTADERLLATDGNGQRA